MPLDPAVRSATTVPIAALAAHVYTECVRIWNPLHTDTAVAAHAGLPGLIVVTRLRACSSNARRGAAPSASSSCRTALPLRSRLRRVVLRRFGQCTAHDCGWRDRHCPETG